jgi:hypothetical protein
MHELFIGDDIYDVRQAGKYFAACLDLKANKKTAIRYNTVCPTDELTPIKGLDLFNAYVKLAQASEASYGVQVKVVDIC